MLITNISTLYNNVASYINKSYWYVVIDCGESVLKMKIVLGDTVLFFKMIELSINKPFTERRFPLVIFSKTIHQFYTVKFN